MGGIEKIKTICEQRRPDKASLTIIQTDGEERCKGGNTAGKQRIGQNGLCRSMISQKIHQKNQAYACRSVIRPEENCTDYDQEHSCELFALTLDRFKQMDQ